MTPAMAAMAKLMSEGDLQEAVREMARAKHWLYFHDHDARRNPEGFPDTVLANADGRLIFAELKRQDGRLSAAQQNWRLVLQRVEQENPTVRYCLWRPMDWKTGEIERVLSTATYIGGNTEAKMDNAK